MGVSEDVLKALDSCSVTSRECNSSISFSESLNAVFFIDQTRNTKVCYEGVEAGQEGRVRGAADIGLDTRGAEEGIQTMAFNSACNLLLLAGTHVSVVRVDNKSLLKQQGRGVMKGCTLFKGMPGQCVEVLQAAWHPLSAYHVVVLLRKDRACYLHVYSLEETEELAIAHKLDQEIPIDLSGFVEVKSPEDLVSFAFGPVGTGSGWERFTVYLLHGCGHIFALCPVIPGGCKVSRDAVLELYNMLPYLPHEGPTSPDPDAEAAHDVLRRFFPTFDPQFPKAGLVESRVPRSYEVPKPQLVHVVEAESAGRQNLRAFNLSLVNPDGSLAILGVVEGSPSGSRISSHLDVGVVLHVIHPGYMVGKWSREAKGMKRLAQIDFKEWPTARPPTVLLDRLRLGTLYVVLSDNVFRADLPIVSKVDSHKHVSYGQWSVKEPTVREMVSEDEAQQGRAGGSDGGQGDVIGACATSRLEGGNQSCLYVRRHRARSFGVEVSKPEPFSLHNLLELQSTKEGVKKQILGSDDSPSMLLSANKYTQTLEQKLRDAKGLLSQGDQEITRGVVGPRRWLEVRMSDRINEITTAIVPDQEDRVCRLKEELQQQSMVKELQDRAASLDKTLTCSGKQLEELGKSIQSLRSRMTSQERHAKEALEVAEKRLERLTKAWEKIKHQVTRRVEGEVSEDASLSEKLAALNLKQRRGDAAAEASKNDARALEELQSGAGRIDRLLENLEERTTAMEVVVEEQRFNHRHAGQDQGGMYTSGGASTPSRP